MASIRSTSSIKSSIILMVMLTAALSLISAFIINGWLEIKQQKDNVKSSAIAYADIIAFNSVSSILFDDSKTETTRLQALETTDFVENIHIYRVDDFSGELEFFASYNKLGTPPVPAKFGKIKTLLKAHFSDNYLELIRPIQSEQTIIGYLYIRGSLEELNERVNNQLYLKVAVLICSLIVAFVLSLKFQAHITKPIEELVRLFKQVANEKDYTLQAPRQSLQELNVLSTSFNTMLDRIRVTLDKQREAELEIRKLNSSLEDKVNQRTTALKDSNGELMSTLEKLHQYQNQLVETEKMASLGDMVAGIAHEVNTPIGLGVTASTLLMDRLKDIHEKMDSKQLTAGQLKKFIGEGEENLNIIYRNLNRAAELISSFKQVAVDQGSEGDREFSVYQLIQEVLLSLKPKLKHHQHQIDIDCEQELIIESKPGPLNQVLINLIMNSIIHAFDEGESGKIRIVVRCYNNQLNMIYSDDGKGINDQLRKRIFDPFVTTKRGEGGSGLGMHLVYNLITQALNGHITVASEEGNGIEFEISLPVKVIQLKEPTPI
ncbi:HAMP domain-containing protein [Catenovulum sp. SM1970]|uniref:ATP-binding protein n=1 Tax=Marinifaba aquimaris TaxID=2741323 RepID=UPI0015740858|nr:ATP-binding protein [Marinifaba aquimaris]NTS78509.1 HAMP domain-containing protein [Marinifaba aquimaris]